MPSIKTIQANMTAGVMDPLAAAREDTTFYFAALEDASNVLCLPQGGCTRRPALEHVAELVHKIEAISFAGATVTAPQGGTAANVHDGNIATILTTANNLAATNPFVVAHIDFGTAKNVIAVDVLDYLLSSGTLSGELRVQYSNDDSAWSNFGGAMNADATKRSRRIRVDSAISARYWRFVRIGATSLASTVSVAEIKFWSESAELSAARLVPFAYSTEEAYMMLATEKNIDVFVGRERQAAISIDHTADQLPILNWTQSLDTLLLFHPRVRPPRIFRQGSSDQFDFRAQPFEEIPQYDYGAGTGGTDEVQRINISQALAATDKFTILLDGERTGTITGNATPATAAANIQAALRALPNTSATGITVASVTDGYEVTFGGDDGKQPWGQMQVSSLAGNTVMDVSRTTKGKYPGEDIMSDTRGWPRAGCFYQERLHMGGIPSLDDALLSSCVSEFYNFDIDRDDATKALLTRATADQVSAIYQIVAGRHLSVFANDGEFYIEKEPIDETSVLKLTTRAGSKEGLRVNEISGALVFVQGVKDDSADSAREIGTSLREFLFVDTEQSYTANTLSKLAGHLIKDPVDTAVRKASSTKEADIELLVNADGSLTAHTVLREDVVNAFVPQKTRDGDTFLAVGVDKKRRVYFVVRRIINGVARHFLELWNDNLLLDGGGIVTITAQEFTATEGQTVFTWTFDNPADVAAIGVRLDGGRIDEADYTANLGSKTVTLATGVAAGTKVRIARMVKQITGLGHLESETVQTFVDGSAAQDVTVTGGVLTLGSYADTEIQYGFNFTPYGKLMPWRVPGEQTLAGDKVRCVRAIFSLFNTGSLEIRANGGRWRSLNLLQLDDDVLDRSTMEKLFTGEKDERGLMGWEVGGYIEFRQSSPAPLTIRAITREVAV